MTLIQNVEQVPAAQHDAAAQQVEDDIGAPPVPDWVEKVDIPDGDHTYEAKLYEHYSVTMTRGSKRFRVPRTWLLPKGNDSVPKTQPPLHHPAIGDFNGWLVEKSLPKEFARSRNTLPGLFTFLEGYHLKTATITLPYTMYGEFVASACALLLELPVRVQYADAAQSGDAKLVAGVLGAFKGQEVTTRRATDGHGTFNDIHYNWKHRDVPALFRNQVGALVPSRNAAFFQTLYAHASASGPRADQTMSPGSPLRVGVWIRRVGDNAAADPKNMPASVLAYILDELALAVTVRMNEWIETSPHPKPLPRPLELVLLGDPPKDDQFRVGGRHGIDAQLASRLNAHHRALGANVDYPGSVRIVDLRGFVQWQNGGLFDNHYQANLPPLCKGYDGAAVAGVGDYLSYLDQWKMYSYLATAKDLRFVVGTESGNMDAMGYTGTPVISIDLYDQVKDTPKQVLVDRIGQYSLLSPLWSIVNWQNGESAGTKATFAEYLRGAMLRYLYATK